jgi:ABC-type methionine transport system permease subunit
LKICNIFSKLYYEAFEAMDKEIIEAIRASGISRVKEIRFVVLPESMNNILSQLFFMFEYNVRSSAILGLYWGGRDRLLHDKLYPAFSISETYNSIITHVGSCIIY